MLNQMEINSEKNGFITLKDQKQNFHSYSTARLINLKKKTNCDVLAKYF